jgi:uncharacterized membrane protein YuzA (DUF378 family)
MKFDCFWYTRKKRKNGVESLDRFALVLVIIGALNWLLVGLFRYDLVANIFGGHTAPLSRIIYSLVGIAGLYCISLLFRDREVPAKPDNVQ